MTFSYTNSDVPPRYLCGTCGATGCKLWRKYQVALDYQELFCCVCAGKHQNYCIDDITAEGQTACGGTRQSDSIGWLVPAVPTEDNSTYWGYSSVPDAGVAWWIALPTKPEIP